jgi:hypothetical protein
MVVAVAGVVIGLGGVAFATIPDSNGTIHGCFNKQNGNLRVVETQNDCRRNENALDWSQGTSGGRVARAYARVLHDGTLDSERSANVAGVSKPNPGLGNLFCVSLSFTPVNAVATPETLPSAPQLGHDVRVSVDPNLVGQVCPEPDRTVLVDTVNTTAYTNFYLVIR